MSKIANIAQELALSKSTGEPLLFKGDDFTKTDVSTVGEL